MPASVTLQLATDTLPHPTEKQFAAWIALGLTHFERRAEVTIRLVDNDEMQALNKQYRHKDKPTNVLSFNAAPEMAESFPDFLGDLVICVPVVLQEAKDQRKLADHHFAHLTLHGLLHLLGYDHEKDEEAAVMENLEIFLLQQLGIENPYE